MMTEDEEIEEGGDEWKIMMNTCMTTNYKHKLKVYLIHNAYLK